MTEADRTELATLLRAMAETLGREITPGQLVGYEMGLAGIPMPGIRRAFARALTTRKFMPAPVDLRELSGEVTQSARAALAWESAKRAVHGVGSYGSPKFHDSTINAVIRNMGGWVEFCGREPEAFETFTRKEFERLYLVFADSDLGAHGRRLTGIHDETNKPMEIEAEYLGKAMPAVGEKGLVRR